MQNLYKKHYSVLYNECVDALKIVASAKESPVFADMTFGAGGHSLGIAKEIENSIVYSVDQDSDAIDNGRALINEFDLKERVILTKMNFEKFPKWISEKNENILFDGILMDLGVSSHHFDKFERGFSFREEAPLDMRMDHNNESILTAAEVLNTFEEDDIANLIFKYADERYSRRIAKNIVEFRDEKKIETTKELEDIVFHCYPKNLRHKKIHPATKTFQALRIFVNRELEVLENSLERFYDLLAPGGVLLVISFHSLEDRIAKHKFREIFQTHQNTAKILTKKPIYPTEEEIGENPRSRSAKLRILKKITTHVGVSNEEDTEEKKLIR